MGRTFTYCAKHRRIGAYGACATCVEEMEQAKRQAREQQHKR
jgi:hypothetical protein